MCLLLSFFCTVFFIFLLYINEMLNQTLIHIINVLVWEGSYGKRSEKIQIISPIYVKMLIVLIKRIIFLI